jgi:hypothetical protein
MRNVTLKKTEVQSIIINRSDAGYSCSVSYFVLDETDKKVLSNISNKYTIEAENSTDTLSADSSAIVTEFANNILMNMDAREEL